MNLIHSSFEIVFSKVPVFFLQKYEYNVEHSPEKNLSKNTYVLCLYTVKKCYMINHVPKAHAINHTNLGMV